VGPQNLVCLTFLTSRARGLHQHRGSGTADTARLPLEGLSAFGGGRKDCEIRTGRYPTTRRSGRHEISRSPTYAPRFRRTGSSHSLHGTLSRADRGAVGGMSKKATQPHAAEPAFGRDCCCAVRWEPRLCPSDAIAASAADLRRGSTPLARAIARGAFGRTVATACPMIGSWIMARTSWRQPRAALACASSHQDRAGPRDSPAPKARSEALGR
jgi:hypothetical protein